MFWDARHVAVVGDGVATDQYPWLGVPFLDEGFQDDGQWLGYLEAIAARRPEVLIPGHGAPLVGAARISARLDLLRRLLRDLLENVRTELQAGTPFSLAVERIDARLAHYRERPDLAERVVSQRFAIYRAWNSVNPDRRGKGWWADLRPKVLRDIPDAELDAAVQGLDAAGIAGRPAPLPVAIDPSPSRSFADGSPVTTTWRPGPPCPRSRSAAPSGRAPSSTPRST